MTVTVKHIPQDTDWNRSFNVLVPLAIQGRAAKLISKATPPTQRSGSMGHQIEIDGKGYYVPSWAIAFGEKTI